MANDVQKITATVRQRAGKGNARATRNTGSIPAIIYGGTAQPLIIALNAREFAPLLRKSGFFTHLMDVNAGKETVRVIPRDVQYHPVSDQPIHVDFLRVSANTRIRVYVPVVFINQDKSPGLKRGGVLNVVQHQVLLLCAPERIPEKLEVDLDGLSVGDTIHVENLKLPTDVKPVVTGRAETTIASIAAPTTVKEEAPGAGAAAPGAAPAAAPAAGKAAAPAAAGKAAAPAAKAPAAKAPAGKK